MFEPVYKHITAEMFESIPRSAQVSDTNLTLGQAMEHINTAFYAVGEELRTIYNAPMFPSCEEEEGLTRDDMAAARMNFVLRRLYQIRVVNAVNTPIQAQ